MNKQNQWLFEVPPAFEIPESSFELGGGEWEVGAKPGTVRRPTQRVQQTRSPDSKSSYPKRQVQPLSKVVRSRPRRTNTTSYAPGRPSQSPLPPARPLTYADVRSDRIDVFAQRALLRMSKNPGMSADAAGMAAAVKSGKLGGIYKEDEKVPALRARKMNSSWWKLIPPGEDAILFLDPENPKGGIPIIVFRNSVRSIPLRLDPALQKAWSVYVQMRTGKLKECSKIPSGVQAEMATSRREAIFTSPPSIIVPPVLCQQTSNGIVPVKSPAIQPVKIRICCLLVPFSRKGSDENIANPANLGIHGTSTEVIGIVYTGRAGFVDLGHLREICDITNSVFDQILSIGGMGRVEIVTTKNNSLTKNTAGFADVTSGVGGTSLTLSSDIRLARAIAFDYGLGHEITSYDDFWMPGGHNSSFSPEDLCSNYLGTLLAERAIMEMRSIGGSYNDIVTNELNKMLKFLDVQSKVESLNAFNRVNHRWIEFNGPQSAINPLIADSYLRRRNFDQVPFKAGHSSDKPTPPFFSTDRLSDQLGRYIYTHIDGKLVNRDDFSTEISRIKADAEKRYGKDFDKP